MSSQLLAEPAVYFQAHFHLDALPADASFCRAMSWRQRSTYRGRGYNGSGNVVLPGFKDELHSGFFVADIGAMTLARALGWKPGDLNGWRPKFHDDDTKGADAVSPIDKVIDLRVRVDKYNERGEGRFFPPQLWLNDFDLQSKADYFCRALLSTDASVEWITLQYTGMFRASEAFASAEDDFQPHNKRKTFLVSQDNCIVVPMGQGLQEAAGR